MEKQAFINDVKSRLATKYAVTVADITVIATYNDVNELAAGDAVTLIAGKFTLQIAQSAGTLPLEVQVYFRRNRVDTDYNYWRGDEFTRLLIETTRTPIDQLVETKIAGKSDATYRYVGKIVSRVSSDEMVTAVGVKVRRAGGEAPTQEFYLYWRNAANQNILVEYVFPSEAAMAQINKY
jgi:hypothetical protein